MDNFSGNNLDAKEKEEFEKLGIIIKHLKPYTTVYCQPLDLNVNYLIKKKMKDFWMEWFTINKESTPKKQSVYNWFAKTWNAISALTIVKFFLISGISNDFECEWRRK